MTKPALIDADCDAYGHPTNCTEPAPGTIVQDSSHNVTVTVSGTTKELATIASATMDFPSHAHDYTTDDGCHQNESHALDPDASEDSPSLTINGSPVYLVGTGVTTDPTTGGSVDIVSNPISINIDNT